MFNISQKDVGNIYYMNLIHKKFAYFDNSEKYQHYWTFLKSEFSKI